MKHRKIKIFGSDYNTLFSLRVLRMFLIMLIPSILFQVSRRPGRGGGSWMAMTSSAASDNQADQPKHECSENHAEVNESAERDK